MFTYPIYNHNWRNRTTIILVNNKTGIKGNVLKIGIEDRFISSSVSQETNVESGIGRNTETEIKLYCMYVVCRYCYCVQAGY